MLGDIFTNILTWFLGFLPNLEFNIDLGFKTEFFKIFDNVCYFFPVKLLMPLVYFTLVFITFRFLFGAYKFIKSHVPFFN